MNNNDFIDAVIMLVGIIVFCGAGWAVVEAFRSLL